jgi:uncharacterized protein
MRDVSGVVPSIAEAFALLGAGLAAGTINTVVGSGTLITFPTLLAFNFPPVLANVSNNVGLVPGGLSGVHGYRAELRGQRDRVLMLGSASVCGGLLGAILLLVLPASAFKAIVPVLICVALVMVAVQPWLAKWVAARQRDRAALRGGGSRGVVSRGVVSRGVARRGGVRRGGVRRGGVRRGLGWLRADSGTGPVLWLLVFCTGVYGGYFGAAQGVLLIGLLGIAINDSLQRMNAVKNVLVGLVNGVAAVIFIAFSHVDWNAAALIAGGSIIGGQVGARLGRRLPPWGLRVLIICVGIAALVKLLV